MSERNQERGKKDRQRRSAAKPCDGLHISANAAGKHADEFVPQQVGEAVELHGVDVCDIAKMQGRIGCDRFCFIGE